MAMYKTFSQRQRESRGEMPDVFTYDSVPTDFRVQFVQILEECLGGYDEFFNSGYQVHSVYEFIVKTLRREYGVFSLLEQRVRDEANLVKELTSFILTEEDSERVMDAVELCCKCMDVGARSFDYKYNHNQSDDVDEALSEINMRLRQRGVGYRYESGFIVRVDSEVLHAEVVKPALSLLHQAKYLGAENEFHSAHEHHRHGRNKECINDCSKAFESTMKIIAADKGWSYASNATAKPMVDLMFANNLIPTFWVSQFTGLRTMLEGGIPSVRNRQAGHGQGVEVVEVPAHIAAYALHQTAAAIVFLVEANQISS